MKTPRNGLLTAGLVSAALLAAQVQAQGTPTLPSMRFLTAPLVAPATAESFYSPTTRTNSLSAFPEFAGRPPEIVELARALKNDPDLIFEFVRNHIDTEHAFGLRKGALGTLINKSGTPFDQNVLFVELARQAGYTARYQIGWATFTGAQFADWTGVSNITAACRLLSSGGIPAAFNGQASSSATCSGLGSTFTSVKLRHIWSQVNIGGQWYAYDPSIKTRTAPVARNLLTGSGLVVGQTATTAAGGKESGTQSGVAYLRNANTESLNSFLQARGTQLLNDFVNNAFASDMDEILGVGKIIPAYAPPGGWRNANPTGYTTTTGSAPVLVTVTGDLPDVYRTQLTILLRVNPVGSPSGPQTTAFTRTLYADEFDGRRLGIDTNFDYQSQSPGMTATYNPLQLKLSLDGVTVDSYTVSPGSYPIIMSLGATGQIELAVDHPYAANPGTGAGLYADQTVVKNVKLTLPFAIVAGFGRVSPLLASKWSSERSADKALPTFNTPPRPCNDPGDLCFETFAAPAGDNTRMGLVANWLGQFSRTLSLQTTIASGLEEHHHSIGIVAAEYGLGGWQRRPNILNDPIYYGVREEYTDLDIESALSLTSKTNDTAKMNVLARSVAVAAATLEGSVLEQGQDLPDTSSTAARFAWGNRPDNEDPCFSSSNPRRFYEYTGTTASTRSGLYVYEGSSAGCNAYPPIVGGIDSDSWKGFLEGAIDGYLGLGFKVVGGGESFLGPGSRFGTADADFNCKGSDCALYRYNLATVQRGGAIVATRQDGSGNVLEVAHILTGRFGISKGGGGKQPERAAGYDPQKAADVLKDRFIDKSSALGVDLKTGSITYATPTLLSVGAGSTPYQLDFSLSWKGGPSGCTSFGPCTGPIQGGWTHNWDIRFSNSGSGLEAMGATSPQAAAGSLVAFLALQDVYADAARTDLEKDLYAALVADWWRRQMVANVATLNQGFSAKQYVRLVSNAWLAPIGAPGTLTQTGSRTKVRDACSPSASYADPSSTSRRWDFSGVSFSLRNAGGDQMSFSPWSWSYNIDNECQKVYGYMPVTWTWPQGPSINFTYDATRGVTAVTTSLGRTLNLAGGYDGETAAYVPPTGTAGGYTVGIIGGVIKDAAGATWKYAYSPRPSRSATQRPGTFAPLFQLYEPVNPTQPALEYTYDSTTRIKTAKDAVALQWQNRSEHQFFIADGARGERLDPAGGVYTAYYDTDGRAVRFIEMLTASTGREYRASYDGRGRVSERSYPEGDRDQFLYDARDNVTQLTRIPKPGSPLANRIIQASWNPTWNKPDWIEDAKDQRTDFSYYASGNGASLLQQAQRPAVAGQRATYAFAYNAIGLPTQETDPTGVVTTHGYNSLGDRTSSTLAAAAIGAAPALNLTTTFTPDAIGNVVTVLNPRGYATTTQYDAMRRRTAEQRRNGGATATPQSRSAWQYDALGRPLLERRARTLNAAGAATAWSDTATSYTPTGKPWRVTDPDGAISETRYDGMDRSTRSIDPSGRVTDQLYDLAGQKLQEIRGVGAPNPLTYASYTYTANGLIETQTDANGNSSQYDYDGFDRVSRLRFPDPATGLPNANDDELYTYDLNNNPLTRTTRSNVLISHTYDALDRESTKAIPAWGTAPARTTTTGYDLAGRRTSLTDTQGHSLSWTYGDAAKRLTDSSQSGPQWTGSKTLGYQYDANGNRTRLTWPDGYYANRTFDALDRMDVVSDSGSVTLADYGYDPLSRITGEALPGSTSVARTYSPGHNLLSLTETWGGSGKTFTASYDPAHRLISQTYPSGFAKLPGLDSTAYSPDRLNRYGSVGGQSQGYDANGNLTSTGTATYAYDPENRLLSASLTGTSASYGYDPLGRRTQKSVTIASVTTSTSYLSDGDDEIAEYDQTGTLIRRYIQGASVDTPIAQVEADGTRKYFRRNLQGSVIALTGSTGTILEGPYTYDAYGNPNLTTGTAFKYRGRRLDPETDLYYNRARMYSATTGRFLQTDPVGYKDDVNLYGYVKNDPMNSSDPLGLAKVEANSCSRAGGTSCSGSYSTGGSIPVAAASVAGAIGVRALVVGGTAAASDGPAPVGDAIGLGVLAAGAVAAATADSDSEKTYVTYTKPGPNGETYGGRASGYGTPEGVVRARDSGHHMNAKGYGPATLDRAAIGPGAYAATRGREQQIVDAHGGVGNSGVGNAINPISPYNPLRDVYLDAATATFGPYQ